MKILAIDTSSNVCSVALLENNIPIKELNIYDSKTHSENLIPLIKELLEITHYTLSDLQLIACNKGPGSFTGIRIGVSSVKAFSQVHNIPIVGVSSLDGLAYNEIIENGIICPMIDCRNSNVYSAIFNKDYKCLSNYMANNINDIILLLKEKKYFDITFIGDGALLHKNLLENELSNFNIHFSESNILNASNIGKCAFSSYSLGIYQNADTIVPMYINKSQAERMQELKNRF